MRIGELAAALHVSREHLARVFARETGSTPHEHMARLRLYHACRLLKESHIGIKEIGHELGIETPQHFARLFKKSMRMTPTQFRQHGIVPDF
jgi:AraC-like DNA-binding protein